MSGGHFNYAYARVNEFVAELEEALEAAGKPMPVRGTDYGDRYQEFNERERAELARIVVDAKRTAKLMRAAEWLCSGDSGTDSFLEDVAEARNEQP